MEYSLQLVKSPIFRAAGLTHPGCVRESNQDSILCSPTALIVADGMGGHKDGEQASQTLVKTLAKLAGDGSTSLEQLQAAICRAACLIGELPGGDTHAAPGTTMSGIVVSGHLADEETAQGGSAYAEDVTQEIPVGGLGERSLMVVNIGDSRTYRFGERGLEQISHDHSAVQELVDIGLMSAEQAERSVRKSLITRAIGAGQGDNPLFDYWVLPVVSGERFLVCSDGLSGEVSAEAIAEVLRQTSGDPKAAVEQLSRLCLESGAHDNFSVIVADVV